MSFCIVQGCLSLSGGLPQPVEDPSQGIDTFWIMLILPDLQKRSEAGSSPALEMHGLVPTDWSFSRGSKGLRQCGEELAISNNRFALHLPFFAPQGVLGVL